MSSIFRKDPVWIGMYQRCHQSLWKNMIKEVGPDLKPKLVDISRDINAKWRDTDLGPHTTLKYELANNGQK